MFFNTKNNIQYRRINIFSNTNRQQEIIVAGRITVERSTYCTEVCLTSANSTSDHSNDIKKSLKKVSNCFHSNFLFVRDFNYPKIVRDHCSTTGSINDLSLKFLNI